MICMYYRSAWAVIYTYEKAHCHFGSVPFCIVYFERRLHRKIMISAGMPRRKSIHLRGRSTVRNIAKRRVHTSTVMMR